MALDPESAKKNSILMQKFSSSLENITMNKSVSQGDLKAISDFLSQINTEKIGFAIDKISKFLKEVALFTNIQKTQFSELTNRIIDFLKNKLIKDQLNANKDKINAIIDNISIISPTVNLTDLKTQFEKLAPQIFKQSQSFAETMLPAAGAALNAYKNHSSGRSLAEQVSSGVVATVKKFAKIENLEDLFTQFRNDPIVGKVLEFSKIQGSTNAFDLIYKAGENVGSTGPTGTVVTQIAKKIAEVAMSPTAITYTLTEAAFTNPSKAVSGVASSANKALETALLAAAKSGEQPLQLTGGDAKQVIEICQAAIKAGIKVEVNTVVPAVKTALETAGSQMPDFEKFIVIPPEQPSQAVQETHQPPRMG